MLAPNVDVALDNFCSILRSIVDKIAPVLRVRLRTDTEPWMTADILSLIKERNALFLKVKKSRGNSDLYDTVLLSARFRLPHAVKNQHKTMIKLMMVLGNQVFK